MTAIRSLADELREKMRQGTIDADEVPPVETEKPSKTKKAVQSQAAVTDQVEQLLADISAFQLTGTEKMLIRFDNRTVFLMKQLKVTHSIDMNKLIAYCVDHYFKSHPELIDFIKSTLQTIDL